jgi:hypothetical protein
MHKPRIGFGGDCPFGSTSLPVEAPSGGNNSAPSGLVMKARPTGDVRIRVPSGS